MIVLSYILQDLGTVQRMLLYSQIWGVGGGEGWLQQGKQNVQRILDILS